MHDLRSPEHRAKIVANELKRKEIIMEKTDGWEATVEAAGQSRKECDTIFAYDCRFAIAFIRRELDRLETAIHAYFRDK